MIYNYCRNEYQTPEPAKGHCQHYQVVFEFLCPCDIRRHQDCDLKDAVVGTSKIFSGKNTPAPLTLKVCEVLCLCDPCITGKGQCCNSEHADPWRLVELIPAKGDNPKKHDKHKFLSQLQFLKLQFLKLMTL